MYTVYSKAGCPFCTKIERVFQLKDITYTKYMLNVDYSKEEFIEKFGEGSTFPRVLDESGNLIGGATETVKYLKESGILP